MTQSDPQTISLYQSVIEDVVSSIEERWRRSGGNWNVLEEIKENWMHRALLQCGVSTPEPKQSNQMRQRLMQRERQREMDNMASVLGIAPAEASGSGSDYGSDDDMTSDSGSAEEESSDHLGSDDDDPEILNMVSLPQAKDHILCHFCQGDRKKSSRKGAMYKLGLKCIHMTLNGRPFVVKSGEVSVNKPNN